jgi:hypothetical protein
MEDDTIIVWVDRVGPDPSLRVAPGPSTIAVASGLTDAGERVSFAGEPRYLNDIAYGIATGGEPVAAIVPTHALLG